MNFDLSEDQEELRDAARRLAQNQLKDKAARWDRNQEFPEENKHLLAELGYQGLSIDHQCGACGAGLVSTTWWYRKSPRSICSRS